MKCKPRSKSEFLFKQVGQSPNEVQARGQQILGGKSFFSSWSLISREISLIIIVPEILGPISNCLSHTLHTQSSKLGICQYNLLEWRVHCALCLNEIEPQDQGNSLIPSVKRSWKHLRKWSGSMYSPPPTPPARFSCSFYDVNLYFHAFFSFQSLFQLILICRNLSQNWLAACSWL